MALEQIGKANEVPEVDQKVMQNSEQDLAFEVITHFEKTLGRKANELALHNIVPMDVPIAVQTIESSEPKKPTILFTTGMSSVPMIGTSKDFLQFAELMMVLPGELKQPEKIGKDVWPWHMLQQLGGWPHREAQAYVRQPQVLMTDPEGQSLEATDFAAALLLPNVKGYVPRFEVSSGRSINVIVVMPIYPDEYDLAPVQGGDGVGQSTAQDQAEASSDPGPQVVGWLTS